MRDLRALEGHRRFLAEELRTATVAQQAAGHPAISANYLKHIEALHQQFHHIEDLIFDLEMRLA